MTSENLRRRHPSGLTHRKTDANDAVLGGSVGSMDGVLRAADGEP